MTQPSSRFVWEPGDIEIIEQPEDSQPKKKTVLMLAALAGLGIPEAAEDLMVEAKALKEGEELPTVAQGVLREGLIRWAKTVGTLPDKHEETFADCLVNNMDKTNPVSFCIGVIAVKYAPDQPRDDGGRFSSGGSTENARRGTASMLSQLLTKHGGYSYQPVSKKQPTAGYMVSVINREKVFDGKPSVEDVRRYLTDNQDLLDAEENYAGGWLDTETGKVYLDVSSRVDSRDEAEKLSVDNKQEAFYDLATGESIYTRAREKADDGHVLQAGDDGRGDSGGNRQPVRGAEEVELKYSPDQARDEQGRWTAEGAADHALVVARNVLTKASAIEPALTKTITDAVGSAGGRMEGLQFRIKSEGRSAQKILEDSRKKHLSQEQAAAKISDFVRYTGIFEPQDYEKGVEQTVQALKDSGVEVAKVKNFWVNGDGTYKGINAQLKLSNGSRAELQFHTQQSFNTKQATHPMLEKAQRDPLTTPEEKQRLNFGMRVMTSQITVPPGVEKLGEALVGKTLSYLTELPPPLILELETDDGRLDGLLGDH